MRKVLALFLVIGTGVAILVHQHHRHQAGKEPEKPIQTDSPVAHVTDTSRQVGVTPELEQKLADSLRRIEASPLDYTGTGAVVGHDAPIYTLEELRQRTETGETVLQRLESAVRLQEQRAYEQQTSSQQAIVRQLFSQQGDKYVYDPSAVPSYTPAGPRVEIASAEIDRAVDQYLKPLTLINNLHTRTKYGEYKGGYIWIRKITAGAYAGYTNLMIAKRGEPLPQVYSNDPGPPRHTNMVLVPEPGADWAFHLMPEYSTGYTTTDIGYFGAYAYDPATKIIYGIKRGYGAYSDRLAKIPAWIVLLLLKSRAMDGSYPNRVDELVRQQLA